MPVNRNAHHTQLPATPLVRTRSVTRLGVSVENVVATIDIPSSHQGRFLPERKYSEVSFPERFATHNPTESVSEKNPITTM